MFSPSEFHLKTSYSLVCLVLGSHLLAVVALLIADLESIQRWVGLTATLLSAFWQMRFHSSLFPAYSINRLRWHADDRKLSVQLGDTWREAEEIRQAAVLPYAVLFVFRLKGRLLPLPLVVCPDSLSGEQYRRLRVLALHGSYIKP